MFRCWFATEPSNMAARAEAVPEPPSPDLGDEGDEGPDSHVPSEPDPSTPPPDVDIDGDELDSVPSQPSRPQEYDLDMPRAVGPVLSDPVPVSKPSAAPSSLPLDGHGSDHELESPASSQAAGKGARIQPQGPATAPGAQIVHLCA